MTFEFYGGPHDGETTEVPDDCPVIKCMDLPNTSTFFTKPVADKHAYYFPDYRVVQPYGHMRFAFHFIA